MTAKVVFDTPDLIRLIYSFGEPSHRAFTYFLRFDLRPYPELFTERYQEFAFDDVVSYSMREYLTQISCRKIRWYLNMYKRCFCCARHSINKPMFHQGKIINPPQSVFESVAESDSDSGDSVDPTFDCTCSCRHLTRHFVRHLQRMDLLRMEQINS
jgi:hypothetical protein